MACRAVEGPGKDALDYVSARAGLYPRPQDGATLLCLSFNRSRAEIDCCPPFKNPVVQERARDRCGGLIAGG